VGNGMKQKTASKKKSKLIVRFIQHRIIYQVYEEEKVVKIIQMWTYFE